MSTATLQSDRTARTPSAAEVMERAGGENFPVASWVLGRRSRRQLLAIYGFARLVDQLGDDAPGDRLALLDWLAGELDAVFAGARPEHPVMHELADATRACRLPEQPFRRLIDANRLDQTKTRYQTFDELLDYCRLSAAPVGELVLHVFGAATAERIELSDRICAALQITEDLQDLAEDYARGRVYLPRDDMARFGCVEEDLAAATASPALRAVVAFEVERSRSLLAAGAPLCVHLPVRARLAVAGFVAGGRAALGGIEAVGCDVLGQRPARRRTSFLTGMAGAVAGR